MYCQSCGAIAPTKTVKFHQNIGLLVMRFHRHIEGDLCKSCISKYFWQFNLVNVTLGWWSVISLIVTPIFIINNLVYYIGSLDLPSANAAQQAIEDGVRNGVHQAVDGAVQDGVVQGFEEFRKRNWSRRGE
jgi:hypothetical protein